ncbi:MULTISPECIES: FAD-dependent monooxygenase [unclassified Streptomyces]|uniref:FAD-dependent monooxygenase n=1 Tax=unclassified Streptomyces TaxID=2593676 RepID=UPI002DDC3E64|nr:FAD-dependent monooxygenase [Streptomyces sp. NBC_01750]WSB01055.1 FAD-dependent monooxygenase [Streptomyces sp. NBC_01794]WSD34593.1 FAD-dependent monooxygenase [Streptomyces sp. NBC_01750]
MTDVLIVGAGPTGLTLACDIARRGVAVRIIDKSPAHHRESRGKTLHPRSLEVLEDLGVAHRIVADGTTHQVFRKYFDGAHVSDIDPFAGDGPTPDAPFDSAVFIGQWRIEEILRHRLFQFGVQVELGTEMAGLTQDAEGVTAMLTDGRTVKAAYLVGCDGGHSAVRETLGVPFEGRTEDMQSMVCGDVEAEGLDRDFWHQWFTPAGAIMLWPVPGTRSFQLQASPERDELGEPMPPTLDGFQRLFDRHAKVAGVRLRNATWRSTWRVNVRMVEQSRLGRVFLAGDAAHVHPIAGGLGMNTGIQDAYNLGWKLALALTHQAGSALLDTYEEERLPIAAWTLQITTERLEHVLAAIKEPGNGTEVTLTTAVPQGYRWSSLATGPGNQTLHPGDRAPDAPCTDPTGNRIRLFQLFTGPHFTLLGFGPATSAALREVANKYGDLVRTHIIGTEASALRDTDGHARRAYGIDGDALVLVRPDNHIALVAEGADNQATLAFLDTLRS